MALDDLIRSAVSLADGITQSLQAEVSHSSRLSQDAYGTPTFSAAVNRFAIVEQKATQHQMPSGEIVKTVAKVTFLRPVVIGTNDRIVLPDGTTGPIVDVEGLIDPDTSQGYLKEVWLGAGASGTFS